MVSGLDFTTDTPNYAGSGSATADVSVKLKLSLAIIPGAGAVSTGERWGITSSNAWLRILGLTVRVSWRTKRKAGMFESLKVLRCISDTSRFVRI